MKSLLMAMAAAFLVVACGSAHATTETSGRWLGPGEHWLPLAITEANGSAYLCTLDNVIGAPPYVLRGGADDPRFAWAVYLGQRYELGWPAGFTARFDQGLEVLDESGKVVAGAEDEFSKLCPTAESGVWYLDLQSVPESPAD